MWGILLIKGGISINPRLIRLNQDNLSCVQRNFFHNSSTLNYLCCAMSPLEIIAVIISLIGVTLTIKRNMWCWGFNFIAFVLYAYLFYEFKLYGETILQFFFMVVNFYGFYHWLKGKQHDHEIRIEPLAKKIVILQMFIAALGGQL